jgi:hypothetical protein
VGGQNNVGVSDVVYVATINANGTLSNWTTTTPLLKPLLRHATVVYNGRIYVAGGVANIGGRQSTVYVANINADGTLSNWTEHSGDGQELPDSLADHTMSVNNGRLYVTGGYGSSGAQAKVYSATLNDDGSLSNWATLASNLPQNLVKHAASIYNGHLYIFGGSDGSFKQKTVYVAAINTNGTLSSWVSLTSTRLVENLYHHAAALHNGRIYIIGGLDDAVGVTSAIYYSSFLDNQFINIANDVSQGFNFYTTPSSFAYNNSQGLVSVNYFLSNDIPLARIGNYTGFNATSYGGSARISALTTTTVQGPDVVLLSRSVTAIAPTTTAVPYTGSSTAAIPGSQLLYTIVIKNSGNTTSNTVNVIEKINNTNDVAYYYSGATTANFAISGFSTNTTVNYSTNAGVSFPLTNNDLSGKYDTAIDAIRWTLDSIPANGIATLNYRVVIKQN